MMRPQRANGVDPGDRREQRAWSVLYVIGAIVSIGLVFFLALQLDEVERIEVVPYNELEQALAAGRADHVVVSDREIRAHLKAPDSKGVRVLAANRVEPDLADRLSRFNVPYTREYGSSGLFQFLGWVLPGLMFVGLWYFVIRGSVAGGKSAMGMLAPGGSSARVSMERNTGVTFKDVAGVDEAKEELQEVVDFLKDPGRYGRLGARIPKGVLLVGPPGTGKTLLARALAGEADVTFLSTNGAEFVEMFVGVGAARVRKLFEHARSSAPAIIFIDELDALGRARGAYGVGGHDEKEQTLNQLLAEMDGFDGRKGVIIMAATNRPEVLDPALLRPGRFDRQVLVDKPDVKGREDVLNVHARKVKMASDVDLKKVAVMTPGFAGADLANLINEAALLATRRGGDAVTFADLTAAIERIVAGLEKKTRVLNPRERETVAYHEMGHALVAMSLPGTDPVQKVSIIPRGISALGYTIQRPTEDRFLMGRDEMESRMTALLGGRAAELLIFGIPSTGAADDLAKATDIARALVTRYGMNDKLGLVAYEAERRMFLPGTPELGGQRGYSEETAREIDCAVRDLVHAAFDTATDVLKRGRSVLERGARALLEAESLGEAELTRLGQELPATRDAVVRKLA
jgi:cell division protease FtsH